MMVDEVVQSPGSLLADEMYPSEPPDNPVEDPVIDPVADPVEDEKPTLEADESGEPSVEEPVVDESGEPVVEEPVEVELSSIEELAEHFNIDPEWVQNLNISQKIDGKEVSVSIADALQTHRQVTAGDEYLQEKRVQGKAIRDEAIAERDQLTASAATFGALLQEVESELDRDVKSIDWAALRRDDPAEYAVKKDEIRERKDRIKGIKDNAAQSVAEMSTKNTDAANQALQDRVPEEHKKFLSLIPEWKDDKVAVKERDQLVKHLMEVGHTEKEINAAAYNGALLAHLVKSMRYDNLQTKSQAAKKKVVKIPKVLKPGAKKAESKPNGKSDDPVSIMYGPS
jgi:hypothetical protein